MNIRRGFFAKLFGAVVAPAAEADELAKPFPVRDKPPMMVLERFPVNGSNTANIEWIDFLDADGRTRHRCYRILG